jgi:hypothetical protein
MVVHYGKIAKGEDTAEAEEDAGTARLVARARKEVAERAPLIPMDVAERISPTAKLAALAEFAQQRESLDGLDNTIFKSSIKGYLILLNSGRLGRLGRLLLSFFLEGGMQERASGGVGTSAQGP